MKKILSLILAGLMTLSCAAFVAADDAAVDAAVEQSNTAEDYAIEFLANYGIFKGTSAAELVADADASIQRYQMALFVSRISTGWVDDAQWEDGPANNSTFEDIGDEPANKYLGALSYANQKGIIEGYSASKFAPYDGITYRDALTMVVRTLGYTGLSYPWGYIQKAVELGLNKDLESVSYTDNLTRGQVAIIIYNAMFANTKSGETLAKSIFDCDFGWENIVITASNEATFDNNGNRCANGYVAFRLLKDDGSLGDKTYYVKKAELGLDGDHDDELQVGAAYIALFTVKDDIASMVDADSLNYKTIYNLGITDNAGEAIATLPVQAELANYNVVKDYQKSEIISAPDKHETFVYGVDTINMTRENGKRIALDWTTNNILQWSDDANAYVIAWVYNATLDRYYQYDVDTNGVLYINWMSDKEFEDFYKAAIQEVYKSYQEYKKIAANEISGTAYSKLRLFDVDGDDLAERALFKTYKIGQIYVDAKECATNANNVNHVDGKKYPTYKITDLEGNVKYEQFVEKDHTAHEYVKSVDSRKDKDGKVELDGYAWLNVADFVTTFYKEDGSFENGSIVLYNVNKTTGEIEIVKHITAKGSASDDADSYIATGVLKAYNVNVADPYVNIDGEKLPLGYASLSGAVFGWVNQNMASKLLAAKDLDECQMQYVTYVVVDGRVVDIDLRGATSDVLIVLGYAGVTSDGYIAVYAYNTTDTVAKIYRIASYNGWKKGDYRYYPTNAWADEAFVAGTIYNVTSYDAETNSYNVYTENTDLNAKQNAVYGTFEFDTGYRVISNADKGVKGIIEKMSKDDRYIIVYDDGTIFVKTGIVTDDTWTAHGKYVKVASGAYVIYVENLAGSNCHCNGDMNVHSGDYVIGFKDTAHEIGFVLYDKTLGGTLAAAYDDAIDSDWYLLGSTQSQVRVTDLLTGDVDTCFVSNNIDLVKGRVYITLNFGGNRMIINQWDDEDLANCNHDHNTCAFIERIKDIYCETDVADARYMVADLLTFSKNDPITKRALSDKLNLIPNAANDEVKNKYAADMVGNFKYFVYTKNHCVELTNLDALADNTYYVGAAIYDVVTKNVVVYIYGELTTIDVVKAAGDTKTAIGFYYDDDMATKENELDATWSGKYASIRNATTDAYVPGSGKTTIDTIVVDFNDLYGSTHADIAKHGYLFGIWDNHGMNNFNVGNTKVVVDGKEIVLGEATNLTAIGPACDACSMVTGFELSNAGIVLGENEKSVVTFYMSGSKFESETTDLVYQTNVIELTIEFKADAEGVVTAKVTELIINGDVLTSNIGTFIKNWKNGARYLRGVDFSNLEEIGVSIIDH